MNMSTYSAEQILKSLDKPIQASRQSQQSVVSTGLPKQPFIAGTKRIVV